MKHQRIATYPTDNDKVCIFRELIDVSRNEHDDILLLLDGEEIWQFTPDRKDTPTPEKIRICSVGVTGFTFYNSQLRKPFIFLNDPIEVIFGSCRILLPKSATDSTGSSIQKRRITAKQQRANKQRAEERAFIRKEDRPAVRSFFKKHTSGTKLNPRYDRVCDWLNGKLTLDKNGNSLPDPPAVGGKIMRWVVMDVVKSK